MSKRMFTLFLVVVLAVGAASCKNAGETKQGAPGGEKAASSGPCPEGAVLIPAGMFIMGCSRGDKDCVTDEEPAREVKISKSFCMDKHETTNAQYRKCVDGGKCVSQWSGECRVNYQRVPAEQIGAAFKEGDNPVVCVNWNMAKTYCEQNGKRLPTEAEWEYAARGGTLGYFHWGPDLNGDYEWQGGNSKNETHPVGLKQPNKFGLHDMIGNVREWVRDCYNNSEWYSKMPMNDPVNDPAECRIRVFRGSSWDASPQAPEMMHVSKRGSANAEKQRTDNIGVRCVQDVKK